MTYREFAFFEREPLLLVYEKVNDQRTIQDRSPKTTRSENPRLVHIWQMFAKKFKDLSPTQAEPICS